MAEEAMTKALVLQPKRDEFALKLQNMRLNNLTAKQQRDLFDRRLRFAELFISLSYDFFGLSREQLMEFSEDELKLLDELIVRKARPRAICGQIFTFGVPIAGWIIVIAPSIDEVWKSWGYLRHRKYLKKVYGKEFLLMALMRKS